MSYTYGFEHLKPVAKFSFEELLKYMLPYIKGYCFRSLAPHVSYQHEDLIQEGSLVLWKCWQRYKDFSNLEFIKLFKGALYNRIAEIMRIRASSRSEPEVSIDEVKPSLSNYKSMVDEQFYDREIKKLAENSSEELRAKIMSRSQPSDKSIRVKLTNEQELEIKKKVLGG